MSINSTRRAVVTEQRRNKVSAMYLAGKNQYEIAEACGCSQQQISLDLKKIRAEWRTERVAKIDAHMDKELARLDQVEAEAWQAWERSKRNEVTKQEKSGNRPGDQGGPFDEKSKTVRGQAGDPRFLSVVLDCVKKRCELLGLNAAVKSEVAVTGDAIMAAIAAGARRVENDGSGT